MKSLTFVQYKMMDGKRADGQVYFDPKSGSTRKEPASMSAISSGLQKTNVGGILVGYRLVLCPFYFNVDDRYLRTGDFVDLIRRGMLGTRQEDTRFIEQLVERLVQQGTRCFMRSKVR